jgi:aryl-alcohol dehydrogenase-like predicted oxidoreductase
VGVIPWSPLARGLLTRDPAESSVRKETDEFGKSLYGSADAGVLEALARVAAARGVPRAQVALAWVSKHPAVTAPIIGATRPEQLADAIASLDVALTADEVRELESPYTPQPVQGHV